MPSNTPTEIRPIETVLAAPIELTCTHCGVTDTPDLKYTEFKTRTGEHLGTWCRSCGERFGSWVKQSTLRPDCMKIELSRIAQLPRGLEWFEWVLNQPIASVDELPTRNDIRRFLEWRKSTQE